MAFLLLTFSPLISHHHSPLILSPLNDMVSLFPSTEYIYHSWDLPEGSKEAEELLEALDSCYEEIRTMDDFFGWCKENINIGSRS